MEQETKNINEKLAKLAKDIKQIKQMLIAQQEEKEMEEIELTDWAKDELDKARKRKTKISHEEVRKMILAK
jgi:predicted DNA-binding protein